MERAGAADRVPSAPESGVSNKLTKKNITPTSTLQKLLFQSTNTHTPTHIHTVYTHTHTHKRNPKQHWISLSKIKQLEGEHEKIAAHRVHLDNEIFTVL